VTNDVKRIWKQYDDKEMVNGKLTWKGYRDRVYGPEGGEISPEYAKMIARDERRWRVADLDNDTMIDQKEYECFMHPEDCDRMKDIVVLETSEDIDKNKDGFITLEEYISRLCYT
jgi:hypothetical protein